MSIRSLPGQVSEGVLQRAVVVGEVNKEEISKVDSELVQLVRTVDLLSSRVTLGFTVLGLLSVFTLALLFIILTRMS